MLCAFDSGPSREPRFAMGLVNDVGFLLDDAYISADRVLLPESKIASSSHKTVKHHADRAIKTSSTTSSLF